MTINAAEKLRNFFLCFCTFIPPLPLQLIDISFHPETPSPLAGEGRGEGKLKRKI
jgi:hypothetical protein